jgi:hypothetical protein
MNEMLLSVLEYQRQNCDADQYNRILANALHRCNVRPADLREALTRAHREEGEKAAPANVQVDARYSGIELALTTLDEYDVSYHGERIGSVGRYANRQPKIWYFKNIDGAYGEVRTRAEAVKSLVSLMEKPK